ncbi:hypothetical protein TVAG_242760 [Trichomonas vaginalis G3]|uniref:Uncharacterized protein n=1 Tax=Trichomonas vaginalis (strain ATCC PRA-98 / G3) TaxID=412133 RepID=A2F835_TRIV3|nr:hypothetical protein TVAGG3_0283210 [Trichomonas vaginalis G3]EAX98911.1 hypothetical protein TVAG_242760 [Trichomonas vaginalis G3]KAI5526713.1 hypothetical protein TVAGG3_0283210 [Trichomonas vaginalis G3]|eukprot:XP_001311841.1 hypothetical protein [Trichomonas vaginalis G3]
MLSSFLSRTFANESVMANLRESIQKIALDFPQKNFQEHYKRWADNMYTEGTGIKDPKKFDEFLKITKSDIEALKRQVVIQKMYLE